MTFFCSETLAIPKLESCLSDFIITKVHCKINLEEEKNWCASQLIPNTLRIFPSSGLRQDFCWVSILKILHDLSFFRCLYLGTCKYEREDEICMWKICGFEQNQYKTWWVRQSSCTVLAPVVWTCCQLTYLKLYSVGLNR